MIGNIPDNFDSETRLWFYTANRELSIEEQSFINKSLSAFIPNWTAHNNRLKAHGEVVFNRILLIAADETQAGVSGCGIDKSVRFVEGIGQQLGVDFFDRMLVGFQKEEGGAGFLPIGQFAQLAGSGILSKETPVMDTLVKTKGDFERAFFKKAGETWVRRFI